MIKPTDAYAILNMIQFVNKLKHSGYAVSFNYENNSIYLKMYNNSNKMIYSLSIENDTGIKLLYDKFIPINETLYEKILIAEHDMYGTLMISSNSYNFIGEFHNNDDMTMKFLIDSHTYIVRVPIKDIVDSQLS